MSNEIDFSCIERLQSRIEEMGRNGTKIENKALSAGAEIILKEMQDNCPEKTGKAKSYLKNTHPKKIKGVKTVKIGVQLDDNSEAFYLKFLEYGASNGIIARPFMRPAFENKRREALEKTKDVIREGLGL